MNKKEKPLKISKKSPVVYSYYVPIFSLSTLRFLAQIVMDVSHENRYTVTPSMADFGKRIDVFLAQSKHFEDIVGKKLSRAHISRGIRNGGVLADASRVKPHTKLLATECLTVFSDKFTSFPDKFERQHKTLVPEPSVPIDIIRETSDFVIINKPAGIQVHPSSTSESGTVANWILAHYPEIATIGEPMRPGIVHRLDRNTSGLLIIARTQKSFAALKKLFQNRSIHKSYLAIVYGVPHKQAGSITTPIARSTRGDRQSAALPGRRVKGVARPAETSYRILETFGSVSLIEATPKTGRTHQIRVHLSSIGHPVIGDCLYASRSSRTIAPLPERHLLHAAQLSFRLFEQDYSFSAPIPDDFSNWQELYKSEKVR